MGEVSLQARPHLARILSRRAWIPLGLIAYCAIVVGPMAVLLVELILNLAGGHWEWLALAVPFERRLTLLLRSLGLGLGVAAGAMVVGVICATVLRRWRSGALAYLRWGIFLLVPIPPYLHALGWSGLVEMLNRTLVSLGRSPIGFHGWFASWWVQLMAFVPVAVAMALIGLESIDRPLIEAGRIIRPDIQTFWHVMLPLAAPTIFAGGAFIFLLSVVDYSVPSLFQYNTYALEIFAEFTASNEAGRAFLLSVPVMLTALIVVLVAQPALRAAALGPPWRAGELGTRFCWPKAFQRLQSAAIVLLLAQALVPLLSQGLLAGGLAAVAEATAAAGAEIRFTLWVAAAAALLALPIGLALAFQLDRSAGDRSIWWFLTVAPLVIPSSLVGIGLILVWNRAYLPPVYGSRWMPVLGALARFTPVAAIALLAQLKRIDPALLEAARIYQRGDWQTWVRVRLPMLAPGLLAAAGLIFVLTAGELGATLLIAPPGRATLTMRIYNYLHYGASKTVAGLGLVMSVTVLACAGVAALGFIGWSKLGGRG